MDIAREPLQGPVCARQRGVAGTVGGGMEKQQHEDVRARVREEVTAGQVPRSSGRRFEG